MRWLLPPSDDHPATMLRWVRRLDALFIPLGLVLALVFWVMDSPVWWLGLAVSAIGVLGLSTIAPAIRRAEAHGPNDPATRPARRRRAERMTLTCSGAFTVVAVLVSLLTEGVGLAIAIGASFTVASVLGIWVVRRWWRP